MKAVSHAGHVQVIEGDQTTHLYTHTHMLPDYTKDTFIKGYYMFHKLNNIYFVFNAGLKQHEGK